MNWRAIEGGDEYPACWQAAAVAAHGISQGEVQFGRDRGRDLHPDLLGGLWLGPEVQRTIARQQVTGNLLHHHHHLSLWGLLLRQKPRTSTC